MDKSNKIENLANKYVERHIRDRHLSDDTIKEIKIAYIMIIKDFIAIVDSGLRSHRFLHDKEDDKKQRSTENRLFKKYACRDWDGRGSTQWKSFPTQSPICRGNDGLPFNVDNLTIPYGKWRKESIKAYGNAIVPLIAVKIFEMINKIEGYEQQTTL